MLDFSRVQNYYIACGYTDMRKQIDGLVAMVELQFKQKLDETSIFLFCGRRADRIKALYWDGTGYVLLYKRLVWRKRSKSSGIRTGRASVRAVRSGLMSSTTDS